MRFGLLYSSRKAAWIPNPLLLQPKGLPSWPQGSAVAVALWGRLRQKPLWPTIPSDLDLPNLPNHQGWILNKISKHVLAFSENIHQGHSNWIAYFWCMCANDIPMVFYWMICLKRLWHFICLAHLCLLVSLGDPNQSKGRNVSISRLAWQSARWSWSVFCALMFQGFLLSKLNIDHIKIGCYWTSTYLSI